jgi:hypothetical protein
VSAHERRPSRRICTKAYTSELFFAHVYFL